MPELVNLGPQAPLPEERSVVILRTFSEADPRSTVTHLVMRDAGGHASAEQPTKPDGAPMSWAEAIDEGRRRAAADGLRQIVVIDRTESPRAQEILREHGDHSFSGEPLADSDLEDGEPGSDMRDRRPS